jgi:hypothetical protein
MEAHQSPWGRTQKCSRDILGLEEGEESGDGGEGEESGDGEEGEESGDGVKGERDAQSHRLVQHQPSRQLLQTLPPALSIHQRLYQIQTISRPLDHAARRPQKLCFR